MKKPIKIALITGAIIIYLTSMMFLVWGPTIRMAQANQQFKIGNYLNAQNLYTHLEKTAPSSAAVWHNLGLCLYQFGKFEAARKDLELALSKYLRQKREPGSSVFYYYHLGNAYVKSVPEDKPEEINKYYQTALVYYRKALIANPGDFEAKYNYELVWHQLNENQESLPEKAPVSNQLNDQNEQFLKPKVTNKQSRGKDW